MRKQPNTAYLSGQSDPLDFELEMEAHMSCGILGLGPLIQFGSENLAPDHHIRDIEDAESSMREAELLN